TPANPSIAKGLTQSFAATGTYSDASTQDLTTKVSWTSSVTTIATISNAAGSSGLATGANVGTTQVTAALTGTPTSPAVTLKVAPAEYAYVANFGGNSVSQYGIGTGGVLTSMTSATVAAGTQPYSIAVDPSGHYLYVANYNHDLSGSISQYTIGSDGSLTAMPTPSVSTAGVGPNGVTVDPSGHYVYAANFGAGGAGTVAQFTITGNGSLAAMTPSTVAAGVGAAYVAIDPTGKYAYVPNYGADTVSVYTISAGALTLASTTPLAAGSAPSFALVDPNGHYLYVADQADRSGGSAGSIAQFTIGANGALTPMATPVVAVGGNPRSLTLDPTGTFVYAPNSGANSVTQLSIGAGGALAAIGTTNVGAATAPNFIAVDPTGQYAYVDNRGTTATPGSTVSLFTLGTGSALVPQAIPTAPSGLNPAGIATSKAY
ncbi:MAG: hypothetical protein JWN43_1046, partial [Gammaproteobacteria bacterium]|nr:hypothetical protein [Gammaproteobacteria bacterium]